MRALTLVFVLVLAAALAIPVLAQDQGTTEPAAGTETPSMETAPTPAETPAMGTEAATAPSVTPDVNQFNVALAKKIYNLSDSDIGKLQSQGMSWGEIYMAANMAARANRPVTEVASLRSQGLTWSEIGNRYNVAMADVTTPVATVCAGPVAGVAAGPETPITAAAESPLAKPCPIVNKNGQIVLSANDARLYSKMGYSWESIAVAANISRETGIPVADLLRQTTDQGLTWAQIAREYGLDPKTVMDTSTFPFRSVCLDGMKESRYSTY